MTTFPPMSSVCPYLQYAHAHAHDHTPTPRREPAEGTRQSKLAKTEGVIMMAKTSERIMICVGTLTETSFVGMDGW